MPIVTQKINPRPRLTDHLVRSNAFAGSPLAVIDVGARGGFERHWDLFGDQASLVGFEVDPDECEKLNLQNQNRNRRYFPIGLSYCKGHRTFHVQNHVASSSFYRSREDFLGRFPASSDLIPHTTVDVPTTDLDSFAAENRFYPEFLKLDIEGAELDVFRGGTDCLNNSVFGISAEAVFYPWREGMPTFSDLDIMLRDFGFVLHDLPIFRWERKTLSPYMFEDSGIFGPTMERGQVVWTQAIYLKDPVHDLRRGRLGDWTETRVLKMACMMELYNLQDCAIELIQEARASGLLVSHDTGQLIDLLTPPLNGRDVTYAEYVEYLRQEGPPRFIQGKQVTRAEYDKLKGRSK